MREKKWIGNVEIDGRSSSGNIIIGLVVTLIGLLNFVLGIITIISSAVPSEQGKLIASGISISGIFFGSILIFIGVLWTVSGVGLFIKSPWAYNMALYIAPVIVAINLLGILNIKGFSINIGWAAISTVTAITSIWYLSKKELASFFIISVVEHVVIIMIFAMLIYSKPVSVAETSDAIIVSIEEIRREEKKKKKPVVKKVEPVLEEIKPKPPKQVEPEKLPTLPKMEIQNLSAANPGSKIESAVPQIPKTYAQTMDRGGEAILRSPGVEGQERKYLDDLPKLDDKPVVYTSTKPTIGIDASTTRAKESSDSRTGSVVSRNVSSGSPNADSPVGPSSDIARPGFVGDITGEVAGRKVIFWPKQLEEYKGTQGGSTTIRFWVDPPGTVTRAEATKKSGIPELDRIAQNYVLQIRFAELPKHFEQKTQRGEIIIRFELTRRTE